jgi:hypothetical protein
LGKRRLRHAFRFGGFYKAARPGHGQKIAQLFRFHRLMRAYRQEQGRFNSVTACTGQLRHGDRKQQPPRRRFQNPAGWQRKL